ncbi:methyltransferase family protein [Nocardia tenerifensis]|uniref:Methyltransferase family protein n=1 Tax=Nocardia tenerifensis TaxID=228006 RepID=A0A318KAS6_9NOCA|nr:class I SAM-dependent methyltransferase [Nocardia tenerifensis]PXX71226.1 methyltransferase family protein [Nocardia tenerifensis]
MVESGAAGVPARVFDYDAELRRYQRRLWAALELRPDDTVLDIGCGTGQLTRDVAGVATRGSALGVDISPVMLEQARRISADTGVHNVRFERADAQVHPFPPAHFTLAISRFGTMFFADPAEAFANIGRALRPGAPLVQVIWQHADRQEWVTEIHRALASDGPAEVDGSAFSLADPDETTGLLTAAGFTDVAIAEVREPIYYGPDPDAGVDAVLPLRMTNDALARLGPGETERALERLRAVMAAHCSADGVWFDSCAWLVTATR